MGHEHIRPTRKVAWCIQVPTWTAKMEIQVRNSFVVLTVIADVTFYGRDQAGNAVSATGSVQINFANFA